MNPLDPTLRELTECGCCAGTTAETPSAIDNRPGLDAVRFRHGTHPQFTATMLAALSSAANPALRKLRTRDDDDLTIALLDGAAVVEDVLTFYSERIANEAFLRTADERRSVLELARSIGYELRPGVAASTWLAFTVEDSAGAPGYAIIDKGTKVQSIPAPKERPQVFETLETIEALDDWNAMQAKSTEFKLKDRFELALKGTSTGLKPGDILLVVGQEREGDATSGDWGLLRVRALELREHDDPTKATTTVSFDVVRILDTWADDPTATKVYALRQRAALFGANMPQWLTLSLDARTKLGNAQLTEWPGFSIKEISGAVEVGPDRAIHLDATYGGIVPGSWVVLTTSPASMELYQVKDVDAGAGPTFAVSAKATRLTLTGQNLWETFDRKIRETVVFVQSQPLSFAEIPIRTALGGHEILLDHVIHTPPPDGRTLLIRSTSLNGEMLLEPVIVKTTEPADTAHTKLVLANALTVAHDPASTTIFGNVAAATHGETVDEILGSGDGNQPHQRFVLKQAPLTYTRAGNALGGESTLQVWVDGVRWTEVPSLFERGPRERVYVTRLADDGQVTVLFGDGKNGARLPTGHENVKAVYRKGAGREGLLAAGQLALLMTRPLGVKSVTNPMPTEGGANAQVLADARVNAPTTVLTMDRAVSLEDYADFARNFAGIAKALATWTWHPNARGVLLTVALTPGSGGVSAAATSDALRTALRDLGNPLVVVEVKPYDPVEFKLAGTVFVNPDRKIEDVQAAVRGALKSTFGFERRDFGQPVTLSEVAAVIQGVPGVAYVDIDALYTGNTSKREPYLAPHTPANGAAAASAAPAGLLTIDETSLSALVAKPLPSGP